jgi:hypothetical protein
MERYRHYRPQKDAAQRIGRIFAADAAGTSNDPGPIASRGS